MRHIELTLENGTEIHFILGERGISFTNRRFQDGTHNNGGWPVKETPSEILKKIKEAPLMTQMPDIAIKPSLEESLSTEYNFVRLNFCTGKNGGDSHVLVTNASNDIVEEHIKTALEAGEQELDILVSLLAQDGYFIVPFDSIVTDFDF